MEVQTRSEVTGIQLFPTLKQAFEAAATDTTIWKVSFEVDSGERVRLVRHEDHFDGWMLEQMEDAIRRLTGM